MNVCHPGETKPPDTRVHAVVSAPRDIRRSGTSVSRCRPPPGGGGIGGPAPVDAGPLSMLRLVLYGRFILQVVPTMVSGVSILASTFQPQPVCSSSNIDLSARLPNEEM